MASGAMVSLQDVTRLKDGGWMIRNHWVAFWTVDLTSAQGADRPPQEVVDAVTNDPEWQ